MQAVIKNNKLFLNTDHPDGPLVESGKGWEIRKPQKGSWATLIKKEGRTHVDWHGSLEEAKQFIRDYK